MESKSKEKIKEIVFPAYQDGINENNKKVYEIKPFTVNTTLPDGWDIRLPETKDSHSIPFFTPVDIYNGEQYIGFIGYNIYTPYDGNDVPASDYYKTVYPELRLSSMYCWDPYIPIKTTDISETAVATVNYMKQEEVEKHPGAMPDVPVTEVPGILCYDKEMLVFIGIQFDENVVTEKQVRSIAESIVLKAK